MQFHVRISRFIYDDATVIEIDGDFDLASVPSVSAPADESILTRRAIVFDLSRCTHIDTSALRFLLGVSRVADVPIAVVVGGSPVRSTLAVMAMDEGVPAFPKVWDALEWLADHGRTEKAARGNAESALPSRNFVLG